MKKIYAVFICILVVFTIAGCGNDSQTGSGKTASSGSASKPVQAETQSTGGKALVVYYSATGNTKNVADYIAAETGADVFTLEPAEPYSDDDLDYSDDDSRVSREHENESERVVELVSTTVDGWEDYDTVFIGYPIWWGIAAWPVNGFVEGNDFTEKKVIPFCTSASSGFGKSGELLKDMAGTGNWLEGKRFHSGASEKDVRDWIADLGL